MSLRRTAPHCACFDKQGIQISPCFRAPAVPSGVETSDPTAQQCDDEHNADLHREAFEWAKKMGYPHVMAAFADLAKLRGTDGVREDGK